jgi:hypothetical protein
VLKALLTAIPALLVAFVLATAWALESGGVAVIETHAPGGELRATHVWYAESDGELWLEAPDAQADAPFKPPESRDGSESNDRG